MDPRIHPDPHIAEDTTLPVLSPSPVITPTKSQSRGLLTDLAGWSSYSDMRIQAPADKNTGGLHQSGSVANDSGMVPTLDASQNPSHLPTPQSPGNMTSYLLQKTPTSLQNSLQADHDLHALPTEFRSHASSSPPFRPHSIPTPDPSPLVARSRSSGPRVLSQLARANSLDDAGSATPINRNQSLASTPPRTPSRQASTRPATPVSQGPRSQSDVDRSNANDSTPGPPSKRVKVEPVAEPVPMQPAELRRPDYFKRVRRLAPSSGAESLVPDPGGKGRSLLWSSANMGVIDSPVRGKRIALFQETSDESFEESLMAGGYGRYRSDRPSWKLDTGTEAPNQLGDAVGEETHGSRLVTEEEKRKKARLSAFLNPPRASTSAPQVLPMEVEGCGRVLVKIEPSEPQTPPKPTSKGKRSRKRKKTWVDAKHDMDRDAVAAPEARAVDGPNWPDAEFPWRSRLMVSDGLSSAEWEERLRYIVNFLDRESDEEELEDGLSSGRRSPDEVPRSGSGKTFPLPFYTKNRRYGSARSVIPSDPADAKTALLSKKSVQAVQLRLLRRRDTGRNADSEDDELLCICQGRDDGRPLVQCDACRTWYHLECIGIQSMSELGREEDPWFCSNCAEVKTPPPVVASSSEPTFVPTDDGEHDAGYEPPFLNAGLNPSPSTPWTRSVRPLRTPPRIQQTPPAASGSSWDEPPSSSSRGDPRTPQFNTASAFGDMVRVYGMTPGRSLEPLLTSSTDEIPFDPTSTPSRGIMFGLPFTTPKDGRWGMGSLQGVRGGAHELFHTPHRSGEDGTTASGRHGQYHGRVGEVAEGLSGVQGLMRTAGANNVTPVEREAMGGPKRMQVMESPLGAKRLRRMVDR